MRRHCIILCIPLLIGCMPDTQTFTYLLEPDARKPYVFIKVAEVPGQQWRLWIPEIFSLQNARDRHFKKPDNILWHKDGDRLWYDKEIRESEEYAIRMHIDVMPSRRGVVLTCTFTNQGLTSWGELAHPAFCLSSEEAPSFHNPNGDRSYVRIGGAWRALSEILGEMPPPDVYNNFLVESPRDPEAGFLHARIDDGYVARENEQRSHTLVFNCENSYRVDMNFNKMQCIHSEPGIGPLNPGENRTISGLIRLVDGPVESVLP